MDIVVLLLLGSIFANALLLWALIETRRNAHYYRELFDHWARRADYWRTLFDDLRRNSVQRDPRTGRYVKGYRRHD